MREMTNPTLSLGYHYGAGLFAASLTAFSGINLMAAYAFQPLLAIAGILLSTAAIARRLRDSWTFAAIGSFALLFGGGLFWLKGFNLVHDLWAAYVLHDATVTHPLQALATMITFTPGSPLYPFIAHRPIALGTAFFFGLLFVIEMLLFQKQLKHRWVIVSFGVVLGTALAHTMETSLPILCLALGMFMIVYWIAHKKEITRSFGILTMLFAPMLLIAFVQGGVLTSAIHSGSHTSGGSFGFWFDGALYRTATGIPTYLWSWAFVRDFGIPILALPVTAVYAWKHRKKDPFVLLLSFVAVTHFVFPLIVHYLPNEQDLMRLYYLAQGIGAFLLVLLLWDTWLQSKKKKRRLAATALLGAMVLASTLHLAVRLIFPNLVFEKSPLFPKMPDASFKEHALYEWVQEHTTLDDVFFMHAVDGSMEMQLERTKFMTYAGRFLMSKWYRESPEARTATILRIQERCDRKDFKELGIGYLVQTLPMHDEWAKKTCNMRDWVLVFGDQEFLPRVWKLQ